MAEGRLRRKIRNKLRREFFNGPDDFAEVSDGHDDNIHVVVVSRKFDDRGMKSKTELIWSVLEKHLTPKEWGQITLTVGTTPEEIKVS